jgi:hypothetical protein
VKKRNRKAREPERLPETKAADALTVAWMLSVMTTLMCELAWAASRQWVYLHPDQPQMAMFCQLLFFSALVTGGVSLLIIPFVYRLRRLLPPRGITVFAAIVGAAPWVVLLCQMLFDRQ